MNDWWQRQSPRDRRVLGVGGVIGLLLLGYSLLWEPLSTQRDLWRSRAIAADQALLWMRSAAPQLAGRSAVAPVADPRSLLARVDMGAREAGLGSVLLRVEPIRANQVRVYFQSAPFDQLLDWLQPMVESQGLQVEELSVQRADGVGLVDVRLTLTQAGA